MIQTLGQQFYETFEATIHENVTLSSIEKCFTAIQTLGQQFYETFEATIHENVTLSNIEKFSYLKGYLGGATEKCIDGIPLTNDNYDSALNLLKERFANPQLMIASHMKKLLKIEKVKLGKNCKELRNLYDQIESHVRSLQTVGIKSEHYGPLLIPIILERVAEEIKLEISRKLGATNWRIEEFVGILKDEITARESCSFLHNQGWDTKSDEENRHFTTIFLWGSKVLACAFCGQNHFPDKCNVVTELAQRKEIVWKRRLCFKCLFSGHSVRRCRNKNRCFKCKAGNHHTAICEKSFRQRAELPNTNNEDQFSALVSSRKSVLLQTADALISDTSEKKRQFELSSIRVLRKRILPKD